VVRGARVDRPGRLVTPEETPTSGVGLDYTEGATTFTIHGHIAAGINGANIEQRIVNPDLTDTEVSRRDIRALEGPLTPADKGGYSSSLVIDRATNSFVATYDFGVSGANAARNAAIAAASGGERVLSWERFDVDRMGLTIAEDDEPGGPGMGGCPMGPASVDPTAGEYHVSWGTDANGVTAQVLWGKAAAEPGAAALTGYSVVAVEKADSNGDGERDVVGRRTGVDDVDTTLAGLHGASQDWEIEVRALTEAGDAGPLFPLATSTGGTPAPGTEVDGTVPTAAFAIEAGKVALTSNEADAQIFYSVDGSDLLDASGQLKFGASVLHYTEPFAVTTENTTVKFVAIDAAGNASQQGTGTASPAQAGPPAAPDAPIGLTVTPSPTGLQALVVSWTAPTNTGNLPLSRYQVHLTAPAEGSNPAVNQTLSTPDGATTTRTIGGLVTGREYTVEVRAQNVETLADGTTRTRNGAYTPQVKARPGDVVTGALVRNDAGDIRIAGSGSQRNVTLTIYRTNNAANVGNTATSTQVSPATVTNAVAPATGIDWEFRDRVGAPFPAGTVIWVRSSKGGVASFTV
jgi:hypothetical protein